MSCLSRLSLKKSLCRRQTLLTVSLRASRWTARFLWMARKFCRVDACESIHCVFVCGLKL